MSWEAWFTLAVVGAVFYGLWKNVAGPDVILLGGALVLTSVSVVSPAFPSVRQLAIHFGNEAVLTVGALFVVAAGLTETGGFSFVVADILGRPRSVLGAQLRLMAPVAAISAFLNNTPVVAMFIPMVEDWCKRTGISPSKLLLPLSYTAVLGGLCTLIGTSTNLVVRGLLVELQRSDPSVPTMGMFTLTPVGLPVATLGLAVILLTSRWLLPERRSFRAGVADMRQYAIEMTVQPGSTIDGKTIADAGLRHLPGAFLTAVERDGESIVAVGPDHRLHGHDRLLFVGVVESIVDLQRVRGLVPATAEAADVTASRLNRLLFEVVISDTSPMIGQTIRDGQFRTQYDAAIIAVYRNGGRIGGKIGDIVLRPGDAVLVQAHPVFLRRYRNSRDFLLVAAVDGGRPVRHDRAWRALSIMTAMVLLASLESVTGFSVFHVSLLAAAGMGLSGCLSADQARKSIDVPVLVTIVGALVVGQAMQQTGLTSALAAHIVRACEPLGPWAVLGGVYLFTLILTEFVTNNAAAALAFPVAHAAALRMHADLMPFVIVVAIAASAGFATPLGYQTHLMVYGPGGYRVSDFVRMGLPLDVACMVATVAITPLVYPF